MKNRKAAGAAALAVVLSILLTACASSPGTSGKLEIDPEQTAQADSAADSSATGQTEEQTAQPETEQAGSGEAPDTWTGSTGYRPGRNSFFCPVRWLSTRLPLFFLSRLVFLFCFPVI